MCNRFKIETTLENLVAHFSAAPQDRFKWEGELVPLSMTPAVWINGDGERELLPMRFAFCTDKKEVEKEALKRQTKDKSIKIIRPNNTRIEKRNSWPWSSAFKQHRCIKPLTSFREPSYWGTPAGTEIWFTPREQTVLGVASLYSFMPTPHGTIVTASMIMRPASDYIMECGHHRQPLFIEPEGYDKWLGGGERDSNKLHAILHEFALEPKLTYNIDRHMAASWTKRKAGKIADRDKQQANMNW